MKKPKKKIYNWHFWLPKYKIQVIVPETCYPKALSKMNGIFNCPYLHSTYNKIEFQFGEID